MRRLWAALQEWFKWRRIERAEVIVHRYGYGVYLREYVDDALKRAVALADYATRSGHLTRGFHAGKRVQRDTEKMVRALGSAVPRKPEHIGTIVARAVARIFAGGRGTVSF
jgi:hypothetical protein